jgi:signal transduction histidine kinase
MSESGVGSMLEDARTNAALAWALVVFVLLVAGANLVTRDLLWAVFAAVVAALALVPPVKYRDPLAMLPWEVLLLGVLPLLIRVVTAELTPFRGNVAAYLSVAALALVVAVELDLLTPVEMDYRFAIAFVVVATMAAAGVWAVVRYGSDVFLGTTLLLPPGGVDAPEPALAAAERALMLEFVASFLAGVGAGGIFEFYFRRRRTEEGIPGFEEVSP